MLRPKRIAIALAALVVALLAVELALRAVGHEPVQDPAGPRGLFVADEVAGVRQSPDFRGRHRHYEFDVPVRTDARGLRIADDGHTRPTEGQVIVSLGDSFAHGYGVRGDETYAVLLERRLGVPVHNAGVSSYGVRQMRAALERLAPELAPDVVLFTFFFANDPLDDSTPPMTARGGLMMSPGFAAMIDGSRWKSFALHRSRLALLATVQWMRIVHGIRAPDPTAPPADPDRPPFPTGIEYLARERSPEASARLGESATAIRRLADDARARGAVPVLLVIPLAWQIDDALFAETTAAHGIDPASIDREALRPAIEDLARQTDLFWIDLAAEFRERGIGREAFFPHNQHFNARGHEAAAEAIAAFLRERGIVEDRGE